MADDETTPAGAVPFSFELYPPRAPDSAHAALHEAIGRLTGRGRARASSR